MTEKMMKTGDPNERSGGLISAAVRHRLAEPPPSGFSSLPPLQAKTLKKNYDRSTFARATVCCRPPPRLSEVPSYPNSSYQNILVGVCLDEAQMVESTATAATEMALRLHSKHRWCISGTPLLHLRTEEHCHRLNEAVMHFGESIKEIINEEFGDGMLFMMQKNFLV